MSDLKLSEAIRKGCELVPHQEWNRYFIYAGHRVMACCAMGAAIVGEHDTPVLENGSQDSEMRRKAKLTHVPDALSKVATERHGLTPKRNMHNLVIALNDNTDLTREAIADLLEEHGH